MALATNIKRSAPTIHHKKLSGTHQKQTKSFMKTYWPYLPLYVISIVGLAALGGFIIGPGGAIFGGGVGTIGGALLAL